MKKFKLTLCFVSAILLLHALGCEKPRPVITKTKINNNAENHDPMAFYSQYHPVNVKISPLTSIIQTDTNDLHKLRVYVNMLDSVGLQVRSPAIFRFELYQHVQRTSDTKGKRVAIWPDMNINDDKKNQKYWKDFLRSYEFILPFQYPIDTKYVLQLTCITPDGKRIYTEFYQL